MNPILKNKQGKLTLFLEIPSHSWTGGTFDD